MSASATTPEALERYEVVCGSHDRESWLAARLDGIGASETAGVLGESPWASPMSVYQAKVAPDDDDQPEHLFWGLQLESSIAAGYSARTGRPHRMAGQLLRSRHYPWALATLDGWTTDGSGVWWPLEIKNVNMMMEEHWVDGAPRYIYLQGQHQMLVTGAPRVTVAGLVGGSKLIWEDIERDDLEIRRIAARGEAFWQEHVLARVPPPADGHKATRGALLHLHPQDDGDTVALEPTFFDLDAERNELKETIKTCSKRVDEIDNIIRAALGDASYGELPDGTRYSYKKQVKREHVVKESSTRVLRRHKARD